MRLLILEYERAFTAYKQAQKDAVKALKDAGESGYIQIDAAIDRVVDASDRLDEAKRKINEYRSAA